MKKLFILITALILFLSVSTVCAGLFGPPTAECKLFSIEIPEEYSTTDGYNPSGEHGFYLGDWGNNDKPDRTLHMWEVTSPEDLNRSNTEQIIETHEIDGIKIDKCYDYNESVVVGNNIVKGSNYTHVEFDKDGHKYVIENSFNGKYEDIDLKKDIELVKQVKDTIKHK